MSDEDEWSDEEDTDTPLDDIDPFVVFAEAVRQLQASGAARFQVMLSTTECLLYYVASCLLQNPGNAIIHKILYPLPGS